MCFSYQNYNMMKQILYGILILFVGISKLNAQYQIDIKIKGISEQKVQFAYYYEDKQYVVAEQKCDKKGNLRFSGDEDLPHGVYMIVLPDISSFFDFLITDEQRFLLKTNKENLILDMEVKGSEENRIFFDYQKKMYRLNEERQALDKLIQDSVLTDTAQISAEQKKLMAKFEAVPQKFAKTYPDSFLTKLIKTMDAPANENDLWAEVDLSEAGLIRTPFFVNVLRMHIARHIDKGADYINFENDRLLRKASANKDMEDYISFYLLNFYRSHFKQGMNEVFVHLADLYFLNDSIKTADPKMYNIIKKQRDIYHASFIGEAAKNIKVANMQGDSVYLYDIKSETVLLYFWSSACGHCEKVSEKMKPMYEQMQKKGITVFAVNTNEDYLPELKKYVEKNELPWAVYHDINDNSQYREYFYTVSAPLMYVLDKEKVIRLKLAGEDLIEAFLENLDLK